MKNIKSNLYPIMNGIYLIGTILIDLFAYGRLPDTIATQFSISGNTANTMPKLTYMLITTGIILVLFVLGIQKDRYGRIKLLAANTILFIANIILLVVQLS
jgi:hypothetical protein